MNHKKNEYAEKTRRKALSGTTGDASAGKAKGNFKETAKVSGRDILIGGLGGALAGKLIGRPSFLIGMAVTGTGHYMGSPATAMFGVGLMASGGVQGLDAMLNGSEKKGMEKVKDRLKFFGKNLKHQLYLDKLIPSKKKQDTSEEEGTNGVGNVQYFKHPNPDENEVNGSNDPDFSEANKLEQQLEMSAKHFAQKQGMSGDVSGIDTDEADHIL